MPERVDVSAIYQLHSYPPTLKKKVTLLEYFNSYLENELEENDLIKFN